MIKILISILLSVLFQNMYCQEWFNSNTTFKLKEFTSIKDTNDFKFSFKEGSRTNSEVLTFNSISKTLNFTYETMGGEKPILFILKDKKVMEIRFSQYNHHDIGTDLHLLSQKFRKGVFILKNKTLKQNKKTGLPLYYDIKKLKVNLYSKNV